MTPIEPFVDNPAVDLVTAASFEVSASVSAASIQRIGAPNNLDNINNFPTLGNLEYGVNRSFGSVTIASPPDPENTSIADEVNSRRQGISVKTMNHFDKLMVPLMRTGRNSVSENVNVKANNLVSHESERLNFGQGRLFEAYTRNNEGTFYNDRYGDKLIAQNLIGLDTLNTGSDGFIAYPIIQDFNNFVSPDAMDGVIEVFQIRESISSELTDDFLTRKMSCDMMINEYNKKGSGFITDKVEVKDFSKERTYDFFEDAQETFGEAVLVASKSFSDPGRDTRSLGMMGFVSLGENKLRFYDDSVSYKDDSYEFMSNPENLLSGSLRNQSEVGTRFKSSTCGLLFGESNILGTDSIAFGGYLK